MDYFEVFLILYGDRGFRRFWKEGCVFWNVEYIFSGMDCVLVIVVIYIGIIFLVNGIIGKWWMDVLILCIVSCVDDFVFMGNYINESFLFFYFLIFMIVDELKIVICNEGLVYVIVLFCDVVIFVVGYVGNGVFWFNNIIGKWCGMIYYSEFLWWVS